MPRTYTIHRERDLYARRYGQPYDTFHYRLDTAGMGHWCIGGARSGTFRTEAEAEEAGRLWVETGRPACEQRAAA